MIDIELNPDKIIDTIERLERRVADRFPQSGLRSVCQDFIKISHQTKGNIDWISKPNLPVRIGSYCVIILGLIGLIYSFRHIDLGLNNTTIANIATVCEAIFNDLLLLGAAIFFLISSETRLKRKKALKALNELRVIAHVIDMHQLTKDPSLYNPNIKSTPNSPKRELNRYELERYLDYCSEATSLIGKVAALYSQSLPDATVVSAVNEIETLCNGFSRKIWQKIIILQNHEWKTA